MRPPLVPGRGSRSITFFFFFFSLEALPRRARLGAGAMQAVGVLSDPAEELGGGGSLAMGKLGAGGSSLSSRSLSSLGPCLPSLWGKKSQVSNEHPRKSRVPIT